MKLSKISISMACVVSGIAMNAPVLATHFCSGDTLYPAHRDRSCQLEKWVDGERLPTARHSLSKQNGSSVVIGLDELIGDITVRHNEGGFSISSHDQNCEDVYSAFKDQTNLAAHYTLCDSGSYEGFNKSSYSTTGGYCSTEHNQETCSSIKLVATPGPVKFEDHKTYSLYDGVLSKSTKKNQLSWRQGFIPVSVGGITIFVKGEVTDRKQISHTTTNPWNGIFKSEVNPDVYYALSCNGNNNVKPVRIPLVYTTTDMSKIGFLGQSNVSSFTKNDLNNFKLRCATSATLSVVNSENISNSDWFVKFDRTGGNHVDELASFGEMLLTEANSILIEHNSLSRLNMQDGDIKNQISAEMNTIWGIIANGIEVKDFFGTENLPKRFSGGEYDYVYVSETDLNVSDSSDPTLINPNFNLLEELVSENPEINDIESLFNFDFDYIYDDWGNKKYPDIHFAHWDFFISLARMSNSIAIPFEGYHNVKQDGASVIIESLKKENSKKVMAIISVIEHFLTVVEKADCQEVDKINKIKNQLKEKLIGLNA